MQEGELALRRVVQQDAEALGDGAAAAHALLARFYQRTNRVDLAVASYRESCSRNPFLWSSFEALARAGAFRSSVRAAAAAASLNSLLPW